MRRGREFWRQLIAEVNGGARVADVARRHRVQAKTLSWWRWKLAGEEPANTRFLPVVVSGPIATTGRTVADFVQLRIGDVAIRVRTGTDVAYVAALVRAVRG